MSKTASSGTSTAQQITAMQNATTTRPSCSFRPPALSDYPSFALSSSLSHSASPSASFSSGVAINSTVQSPSAVLARSHSDPSSSASSTESRATKMKVSLCVKSCLKSTSSRATTRPKRPDAPQRSVSFREKDSDEVYTADDWDRSPVDVTPKLTYDDILELKELQISVARQNAFAVSQNARRLGVPTPPPRLCAKVPVGLLPLLPESSSASPIVNSPSSPDASPSYEFNRPLSPPNTPPRRLYNYVPPPDPPVKRAFVFVPLLDNSSSPSPAATPTPSACPSPRLQPTTTASLPSSPPMMKHSSPVTSPVKMAFPPSPPLEAQKKTSDSYFSSNFVPVGPACPSSSSSSSSPRKNTTTTPTLPLVHTSPPAPVRKFRLPTMPLLPPQSPISTSANTSSSLPSSSSKYPSSPVSSPSSSPHNSRSDRPTSPIVTTSSPRPSSPRPRSTPQRSNFVGVGSSAMVMS